MKKIITSICVGLLLSSAAFAASSRQDLQDRIDAAKVVLDQIMGAKDSSIPMNIMQQATCIGVVPGMIKGAFVFGGQYGRRRGPQRFGGRWLYRAAVALGGSLTPVARLGRCDRLSG